MNKLQSECPVTFCVKYTRVVLNDLKSKQIWNSWHPVMERILLRTEEMKPVYRELTTTKGVLLSESCPAFRLTLEAIWASGNLFDREIISRKKGAAKELAQLHEEIQLHAARLSESLQRQRALIDAEDFHKEDHLSCVGLITRASQGNGHYSSWLQTTLEQLNGQFDGKYWPAPEELVSAIGTFEAEQPLPVQGYLPEEVMTGRSSVLKNFVLGFDNDLAEARQIPRNIRFSDAAMATITNIVLDLPVENFATEDAVRVIRHRKKAGKYDADICS